ncbi:hypothetical protein ES731_15220 [Psychroflexus gondwanensis]|nr:hypothetical protein ES731_15210 [Psychroflexus gondwanensis]TXE15617.1 hypothetical protein ES731_15220 [Psychroflexus gondwanensis]
MRVCVRGFSEGKSEASKQATNFGLAKTSNFFYTVLPHVFILLNSKVRKRILNNCLLALSHLFFSEIHIARLNFSQTLINPNLFY